jgi:ATP-dependent Clp protease ATP-binding subunit ClpA
MMFERFTADSRQVVVDAQAFARRLGHRWIGTEHLLYAIAASPSEIGDVLRARDVTPERVEQEFLRLIGPSPSPGELDRDALAAIGIDLDIVQARVEAVFGAGALAPCPQQRRRWPRSRHQGRGPVTGHIPFTKRSKKCLELTVREAQAVHSGSIGIEHMAAALLVMSDGVPSRILAAIGVSGSDLRMEVLGLHRRQG